MKHTIFGESHGEAIGVVLEGVPAGLALDLEAVQRELDRRRPGRSALSTARKEADQVRVLSGMFEGKTTGTRRITTPSATPPGPAMGITPAF